MRFDCSGAIVPRVHTSSPCSSVACGSLALQVTPAGSRCRTTTFCTEALLRLRTSSWQAIGWFSRADCGPTHSTLTEGCTRPARCSFVDGAALSLRAGSTTPEFPEFNAGSANGDGPIGSSGAALLMICGPFDDG